MKKVFHSSPITIEMVAVDVDIAESALRNVNFSSDREIVFQPEQESAKGSFSQQRCRGGFVNQIRQEFNFSNVCDAKNYELNGTAMILVISPLKSIIEDQLQEMELLGYHAK